MVRFKWKKHKKIDMGAPKGHKPYNTNGEGGRPRDWDEKCIEIERLALEDWINNPDNYFFNSFLNERRLTAENIERFCNYSKRFRETCIIAKGIQEQRIVEGAMTRKFDSSFSKFVLQNKAGWVEKQQISGDKSQPLAIALTASDGESKDLVND